MPVIGTFKPDKTGYTGTIRTLTLTTKVRIVGYERKGSGSAPDYRLFFNECEIGAAWRRTARESEAAYLSVRIDDPALPEPIHAALLEAADDGVHRLLWRRDRKEDV